MKKILFFTAILLVACSSTNEENIQENIKEEVIEEQINIEQKEAPEMIVGVDTILEYRDNFKEKTNPTIEEIGEENLANYLFQQFNQDINHNIGSCFCHMY